MRSNWIRFLAGVLVSVALVGAFAVTGGMKGGRSTYIKDAKENVEEGMMVILEVEGKHICLFVDTLIGKQEIVVKPIPPYIKKVKGLSGCTQLGDGSIALILDPGGITE